MSGRPQGGHRDSTCRRHRADRCRVLFLQHILNAERELQMTADNENKRKGPFGTIWETCPMFPGKVKILHFGFDDPPQLAKNAKK